MVGDDVFTASPAMPLVTVWFIDKTRQLWSLAEEFSVKCNARARSRMKPYTIIRYALGAYVAEACITRAGGKLVWRYGVKLVYFDAGTAEIELWHSGFSCKDGHIVVDGGPVCWAPSAIVLLHQLRGVLEDLAVMELPFPQPGDARVLVRQFYIA